MLEEQQNLMDPVFNGQISAVDQCQLCGASFPSTANTNSFTLRGKINGIMQ